jgi:septum formation protein
VSLILASGSAIRAAMLHAAVQSRVDEDEIKLSLKSEGVSIREAAQALAELKAHRVSQNEPADFVIAADSMLACEGRWYDKPEDRMQARDHLLSLRGKTHELVSAVVVARGGSVIWRHTDAAKLTMREFSDGFLDAYLAQAGDAVLSSVGCYQLEGLGVQLFSKIQGDHFTILGLPLLPLLDILRENKVLRI